MRRVLSLPLVVVALCGILLLAAAASPAVGPELFEASALILFALAAAVTIMESRRAARLEEEQQRYDADLRILAVADTGARSDVVLRTPIARLLSDVLWREKQLTAQQQALMTAIINALGEGVLAINRERRVVLANDRVSQLFGLEGTLVGRSFLEVVRQARLAEGFLRALAGGPTSERFSIHSASESRTIEMRIFPVDGSDTVAAVALLIDVTHIERLESIRRDFISDFSHEARTPLAALSSAVESFEGPPLPAAQEEQLRRIIVRQLKRLERLVRDLAELNRIESGEAILEKERHDLRKLLGDAGDDFSDALRARNLTLQILGEYTEAWVDPIRVQQIAGNLLENAIKHSSDGERILIEVDSDAESARFRVTDFGEGIAEEEREKIFHRFYRVDKSRAQHLPGSGLGLSITRHLVLLHGGTISVQSEPGRGATFEVRLPREGTDAD